MRLHNVVFKFPVLKQPSRAVDWRRVALTNWTRLVEERLGRLEKMQWRLIVVMEKFVKGIEEHRALINEVRELAKQLREIKS
ncbi:hypothetical protein IBX38_09160 [Candidatus Bathyarchaeota archaeon]|nr:hypothetical protein [Candidatus Bathyarchaeota archaeon]